MASDANASVSTGAVNGDAGGSARRAIRPPPKRFAALEQRSMYELSTFLAASPLLRAIRSGESRPVLVLPGFGADDASTRPLRSVLKAQGHWAHGWRLGRNTPTPELHDAMTQRLLELHTRHHTKVALIGISLGGMYARELARTHPHTVHQVITLGSPFRMRAGDRSTLSAFLDRRHRAPTDTEPELPPEHHRPPLPVPVTCIYTRTDGLVRWHSCIETAGPHRENIEVRGSHSGLGHNVAALIAISDRLAQPHGQWRPFQPRRGLRRLYPNPASWQPPTSNHRPQLVFTGA
jgi:pimeloyl-ACP methyl ester carboxylesterase